MRRIRSQNNYHQWINKRKITEGVSPYRIWDVVRHKIPGMSEVTMMYNRPTTDDLIEAMEVIAK